MTGNPGLGGKKTEGDSEHEHTRQKLSIGKKRDDPLKELLIYKHTCGNTLDYVDFDENVACYLNTCALRDGAQNKGRLEEQLKLSCVKEREHRMISS